MRWLALPVLLLATGCGDLELVVRPKGGGEPLLALPLEPGERFTLCYTHSVDRQPVWEVHSVGPDGTIYVEEERCVTFGAGMGAIPGRGKLGLRNGLQIIEGIHEPIGGFVLQVSDHTIEWRDESFDLSRLAPDRAVTIATRRR